MQGDPRSPRRGQEARSRVADVQFDVERADRREQGQRRGAGHAGALSRDLCGARGRPAARKPRAALGSPARGTRRAHERDAGPPNREEGPRDHREDRVGAELARRDLVAVPRGVREQRFRLAAAARAGAARRRSGPDPHGARQARADLRRPRAEYARARSRGAARGLDRQPQGRLEPERRVSAGHAAAQRDPQRRLRRLRRRAYEAARGRRSHRRCRAAARAAGAPRADGAGLGCGDREPQGAARRRHATASISRT